jgi:CheY-like chemotaxis protein
MLPKVIGEKPVEEALDLGRKAIIMVADDDPQMLNVTSLVLESHGYTVLKAKNGQEVLEKLDQVMPDMLVLDILMPVMDGFEVLKHISERDSARGREMSIIILSAVKEGSSRQRYELETRSPLPIDDYLEKPISPPAFLQRVEKILQSKVKKNKK